MRTLSTRHDRLILKAIESEETKVGGSRIVIPDQGYSKSSIYKVVATGPGNISIFTGRYIPTQYQVGDIIYCNKAVVNEIEIDGEVYGSTRDNEPLGYVTEVVKYTSSSNEDDELPL